MCLLHLFPWIVVRPRKPPKEQHYKKEKQTQKQTDEHDVLSKISEKSKNPKCEKDIGVRSSQLAPHFLLQSQVGYVKLCIE